jgi:hypothetical protein
MSRSRPGTCCVAVLWMACSACAAVGVSAKTVDGHEMFLKLLDAALAGRSDQEVVKLADVDAWTAAGYPDPGALELRLPPAPLTRTRALSDAEVLYKDGTDRLWRVVLRSTGSAIWKATIRASPCPKAGARRTLEGDAGSAVKTWTILECWPLPR